jgi:hypothetical protein
VVTTKRAPVGLKDAPENSLNGVSNAYTSKLDGSAIGTKPRNLGFASGWCKVADRTANDILSRQPYELTYADAGVPRIAIAIGDENSL